MNDTRGLTDTNVAVGTVDYAAPEQLMGESMDGRADQYSLAATAYHLLTGTPPFRDSNVAVVIGRHLNAEPPAIAEVRPELAPLDFALSAALAKDPNHRFATCSDFARALAEQEAAGAKAGDSAARTMLAPRTVPQKSSFQPSPSPLAPGWYPNPSGDGGTLYWDGRGWHTAPLPKTAAEAPRAVTADTGKVRQRMVLTGASIGVAAALVMTALVFAGSRITGVPEAPTASSTSSFPEPTFAITRPPISATETTAESPRSTVTRTTTVPPLPPSTSVLYWDAMIVGTCDEGGSCGLKQRTAPFVNAPRLHPNDLVDGTMVRVVCQTTGDVRTSDGHGESYVWYRLVNGAYVNMVYTTLKAPIGMPSC